MLTPAKITEEKTRQVLLASRSPRRLALLRAAGLQVRVQPADVDEVWPGGEPGAAVVALAQLKLQAVQSPHAGELSPQLDPLAAAAPHSGRPLAQLGKQAMGAQPGDRAPPLVLLAADTMVVLDGLPLGKPAQAAAAFSTLRRLSGRTHHVWTGFALAYGALQATGSVCTEVSFRSLKDAEIAAYVATGESLDKAGAYGIQGAGCALVDRVQGSYTNVVGLPLQEVLAAMQQLWQPGAGPQHA
jgi:septum formation protein